MIEIQKNEGKIVSMAPGRTCLFGDHQDYLGLPIIACAISRHIVLTAVENKTEFLHVKKPDINKERTININDDVVHVKKGDHLLAALKVVKRHGCIPTKGYDITIVGNIPINAGTSSSSALVTAWIRFLLEAYGANTEVTPEFISQIAYEAEVAEHGAPGGKMDQYSIGLGNIIYLETGKEVSYKIINKSIPGLIIGESGIPKKTIGVLKELKEKAWLAINTIKAQDTYFKLQDTQPIDFKRLSNYLPDHLIPSFYAAVSNHDITKKALKEFNKDLLNFQKIGALMNDHHKILRDVLNITVPKIDNMINGALLAGAYGAKIVGSGKGGSIVAIAPQGKEDKVINEILKAGAKDAYQVYVDPGARVI